MSSSRAAMSVRLVLAATGAVLIGGIGLAAPAAAHGSVQPTAADVFDLSTGRLGASSGALIGLIGVVVGVLTLIRPAGRFGADAGRFGLIVALTAGLVGMVLGGLVAATAEGGVGTGNGLGGAFVALALGLIAMVLGGLALARSRRTS